jgi:hypothetical protein
MWKRGRFRNDKLENKRVWTENDTGNVLDSKCDAIKRNLIRRIEHEKRWEIFNE